MQGLLLINKPKGITSFSAVSAVKRAAHEKRVGHTGTLDPMATGVLPVFLGRATMLSSLMLDADKKYIAEIQLGITTDTCDITGEVLQQNNANVNENDIERVLAGFKGKISQVPPMYSALKKDGVRLYDLARQGKTVEIEPREIEVLALEVLRPIDENNRFTLSCHVSKGTYIRSLARDIGEALGCGATLTALQRVETAGIDISQCVDLDKIDEESINGYLLNEETAVKHLRALSVTKNQAVRFCNGGQLAFERLNITNFNDNELFRIKYKNQFLGIGIADCEKQQVAIKCIINYPEVSQL
ncbi:MAG: tRNA pseudouridine(55) synthase TruB [Clostridia bacterium]|nr:tRNA pseudouridine(55) synthase TruB [Clostridia bacterium]